ncbi:MAG: hypothetical protein AAFX09_11245 [Pseudomonadota bacterium]
MLRMTLIELLLFCAPFAAFFTWRALRGRRPVTGEEPPAPYQMLALMGATLAILAMVTFALISAEQGADEGVFVPPSLEDGEITPGRIEPVEQPTANETPTHLRR